MHLHHLLFAFLFSSIQCAPLSSPSSDLLRSLNLTVDELGATVFALLYGTPLMDFYQLAEGTLTTVGSNVLGHKNATATASTHNVVRPNVDTIYGSATYDLSATDLVLVLPPMDEDRFYLFAIYDPYGDNFASIGSVPASAPGKYLIRSLESNCDDDCEGYEGCITSPTPIGTILVRIEVKNNSTDVAEVNSYFSKVSLTSINPRIPSFPALTLADFDNLSNNTAVSTLELTARLESRSPPETAHFQAAVPPILALAGITNGHYKKPASVNLTRASELVNASVAAFTNTPGSYPDLGNGWSILNNSYSGTFESGTAIIPRTLIAIALYLQNKATNALYPTLGSTQLSLTDSEAYLFTFSGKPPVAADGFWSLTMYDDTGYLVPNALDTYAVGDRSNITYPSGDLVYADGAKDGSFQVLVQDVNVAPPSNWTANWLPAPSGGGSFTVTFRLYAPEAAASNGSYVYPVVTKGDAITA
ncbi:uncharacterized protein BDZ99DRAFT_464651 [Mytilinidion resinicola]|uniref:DUF1254-domain-containing protein n=1 Tax=Mytilinidion resinicola TaxID=574789 RepID=A0A6A6YG74_9PEZI|nr:uncharacterized protein BDZ99DRAFT_464651 [Mytilinidion resinicola]KAF2807740.1 hypothetical protein BDZ99DRAFT_464651 [Mytilinidion resinicola]